MPLSLSLTCHVFTNSAITHSKTMRLKQVFQVGIVKLSRSPPNQTLPITHPSTMSQSALLTGAPTCTPLKAVQSIH